ncbi:MAG TPA: ribonuclease III [Pyrinomonadaceae bacterium]|nr:ribonuclease III [Pyrinomonadaceae bacterium]
MIPEKREDGDGRGGTQDLAALERALRHTFQSRALLERALTHRSWAHEHVGPGAEADARRLHNEALEFVGDSVLGLVVADTLFRDYPRVTEGELSRMKHRLVSAQTLARAARRLGLGEHLRVGRGEEKTGGRRKRALLADAFEAVLAAVYLDGGFEAAERFVLHALGDELSSATPEAAAAADFKTLLQERLQAERRVTPSYSLVDAEGPPHRRVFRVTVNFDDVQVGGEGHTIKSAEMEAARRALEQLDPPA